jgi:hypothetical protein
VTRENRYNLIFIAVLIALLTPGAVILFRKKMQPAARPMYLPDPVPRSIAYMSRGEVPPGMTRVEPAHLAEWKAALVKEWLPTAGPPPRDRLGLPVMSEGKAFELLAVGRTRDDNSILVMLWQDVKPDEPMRWTWQLTVGRIEQSRTIVVPDIVRQELGDAGVLAPPHQVTVQKLRFNIDNSIPTDLTLVQGERTDSADIVQFFTSPAPASN